MGSKVLVIIENLSVLRALITPSTTPPLSNFKYKILHGQRKPGEVHVKLQPEVSNAVSQKYMDYENA